MAYQVLTFELTSNECECLLFSLDVVINLLSSEYLDNRLHSKKDFELLADKLEFLFSKFDFMGSW